VITLPTPDARGCDWNIRVVILNVQSHRVVSSESVCAAELFN
jgi:chorismate-pyruvate lyase